jgi:hypothetical protein
MSTDLPYPALCLIIASVHSMTSGHEFFTFEMLFSAFRDQFRASMAAPVHVNGGSIGMVRCSKSILLNVSLICTQLSTCSSLSFEGLRTSYIVSTFCTCNSSFWYNHQRICSISYHAREG